MTVTIEVDSRGRAALGKIARSGTYRASVRPDGAVVLEPAQVLTDAELQILRHPEVAQALESTFAGTPETVDYDWR